MTVGGTGDYIICGDFGDTAYYEPVTQERTQTRNQGMHARIAVLQTNNTDLRDLCAFCKLGITKIKKINLQAECGLLSCNLSTSFSLYFPCSLVWLLYLPRSLFISPDLCASPISLIATLALIIPRLQINQHLPRYLSQPTHL